MTPQETAMMIVISENKYIVNNRELTLYNTGNYRIDKDYNTKEGKWFLSKREDGFYIVTLPDLGILKVDISIQMVF